MAEGNAGAAVAKNRWIYLVIGFVVSIVLGLVYAWSIFTLPLEKAFGWTRSDTSLAFSFSIVTLSLGMIVGGRIQDRKGPKLVAVAGAACLAIGFFAASFTSALWMLYFFYGILVGLGVGLIYICLISVVARWYPDKRGLGMGILTMGLGLGAFLLGGSTSMMIDSMGWQTAFKFLAVVSLVVCVGGAALIKLPPADYAPVAKAPAGSPAAAAGPKRPVKDYNWNEMMQTAPFWTWFVWDLFLCSAGLMIIGHIVPMAVENGVDKAAAIIAMSILSVSNGLGRFLYGYLWDAIGRRKTMVLAAIGMVIGLLGLLYLTTWVGYAGFILAVIITGSSYGGLVPINNTFLATSFGPKNAGVNVGLGSLPLVAAVFIGPYLGAHIKMASGYDLAIILGGAVAVISFIVAFFIGDAQEQAGQ